MKVYKTKLEEVKKIRNRIFFDERGYFYESYTKKKYNIKKIKDNFIQDNISFSNKNVIRGLHFQKNNPQSQLVTLLYGNVLDVIVDLRIRSKTYKKWILINLDYNKNNQIYIPPGCAHGFCVLSDFAIMHYKVTKYFRKDRESGIKWNDPTLAIKWPIKNPVISKKDNSLKYFKDIFK